MVPPGNKQCMHTDSMAQLFAQKRDGKGIDGCVRISHKGKETFKICWKRRKMTNNSWSF